MGLKWKTLSESERAVYKDKSNQLLAEFKLEHPNWREILKSPIGANKGIKKRKRNVLQEPVAASSKVSKLVESSDSRTDETEDVSIDEEVPVHSQPGAGIATDIMNALMGVNAALTMRSTAISAHGTSHSA
jgi:hypothetical protein